MDDSGRIHSLTAALDDPEQVAELKRQIGTKKLYELDPNATPDPDCGKCKGSGSVPKGLFSRRRKPCPRCMTVKRTL